MPLPWVEVLIPEEMRSSLLLATCLETCLAGPGLLEHRFNAPSWSFSAN